MNSPLAALPSSVKPTLPPFCNEPVADWRCCGWRRLASWLAALSLSISAQWTAADEAVDEAVVRRWVVRLDADRKADREAAESELIRLGPRILEWLPEPQSLGSRAASEGVKRVRVKLERLKAEGAVEASRVTIGNERTVADVLNQVSRETGNQLDFKSLPMPLLSQPLDWPDRPTFWNVIDRVARERGVQWELVKNPARLRFFLIDPEAPADVSLAVAQSHAFRIALQSATLKEEVGAEAGTLARFEFDVACEPRLRPLFLTCAASDLQVSEIGASKSKIDWPAYVPDAKWELSFGQGRRRLSWPVDFRKPRDDGPASLLISGKLHVLTAAGEEPIDFPAGAESRGAARRRGGVTVSVRHWEASDSPNGPTVTVEALVVYDASGIAFESHRTWMLSNVAGLRRSSPGDQRDELLLPADGEVESQLDGAIRVRFRFENLPAPASELSFRYVAPTLLLDVPLSFTFPEVVVKRLPKKGD